MVLFFSHIYLCIHIFELTSGIKFFHVLRTSHAPSCPREIARPLRQHRQPPLTIASRSPRPRARPGYGLRDEAWPHHQHGVPVSTQQRAATPRTMKPHPSYQCSILVAVARCAVTAITSALSLLALHSHTLTLLHR